MLVDTFDDLLAHSVQNGDCVEWTRARSTGYGVALVNGRRRYIHRLAWEMANGRPVPTGMVVCHSCDNPPCFNPAHLFTGTQGDNLRDMASKGRWRSGYSHCKRGHAMTGENIASNGPNTTCRACRRITSAKAQAKQIGRASCRERV